MGKTSPELEMVTERKIAELLPALGADRPLEASGVLCWDDNFYIVCDNIGQVARINCDFQRTERNAFLGESVGRGFEAIARSGRDGHFFLIVESQRTESGEFQARLVERDCNFEHVSEQTLDFTFEHENRGFEGVAVVDRDKDRFLLALCEGNKCRAGKKGRKPGGGRIQVFQRQDDHWLRVATVKLPKNLPFEDYAGLALDGNRVSVVSQRSSGLWIGCLDTSSWAIDGPGQVYQFPRSRKGKTQYGNVEGVCWIGEDRVAAVSDKRKADEPKRYEKKDQSIHIFEIPDT
jgi:hypothetical protein